MYVIIDRVEGEYAVVRLEIKAFVNMAKCILPSDSR